MADALGVALQLTNILRDLIEDRDVMGRVYVPAQDLERFGVSPGLVGAPDNLLRSSVSRRVVPQRGTSEGWRCCLCWIPRSRACTAAMAGIYHRLLERIRMRPESVLHGRVSLSAGQKATVAAMALARAAA